MDLSSLFSLLHCWGLCGVFLLVIVGGYGLGKPGLRLARKKECIIKRGIYRGIGEEGSGEREK